MIRVTSGTAKGRKLELPKNTKITAVKEVVKLAIFSILDDKVKAAACLDLFSGSGNLGIEALSRGAAFCDFVDESKISVEIIEKNLRNTRLDEQASVIRDEALKFLANTQSSYDIIFADPYYAETGHRHLIQLALSRLNNDGTFVFLSSSFDTETDLPKDLKDTVSIDSRRYGGTYLTLLKHLD